MTVTEKPIHVTRGDYVESTHDLHIAVVNTNGDMLYSYGDPFRPTFARSSMKPFQAVPLLETGAAEQFSFQDADIALSCASHSGESFHRSRVLSILERIDLTEDALQCGAHIPRDIEGYKQWIRQGNELTPVFSNCSGKHSGMLSTAVHMGEDTGSYLNINHPVQQRILHVIEALCDYNKDEIGLSVDGCGVPVHRLPLNHTTTGFARLARPDMMQRTKHVEALQTIRDAMMAHPEMVGGTKRFDTDVMHAFNEKMVAKGGAEGVQCIGVVDEGLGITIKVEDGNGRAASAASMDVFKQLGIGNKEIYAKLKPHIVPSVKNIRKEQVGQIKANFKLKKH